VRPRPAARYWPVDEAYAWLCRSRRDHPPNADVWHLRFHWRAERRRLLRSLRAGTYRFEPVRRVETGDGDVLHLWSSRDALVLKALSLMLAGPLGRSCHCTHLKHHGGLKATVVDVARHLPHYRFVLRTDVRHYYASLDHEVLLERLAARIRDRFLMNLLAQYLRRTVDHGGVYVDIRRGIARGCALSPLIGAFYLETLDEDLARSGLYYVRYMDDILVLSPTRWRLRRAVATLKRGLAQLKLSTHPDKTFIGRIERGFDFLGYHFSRQPLRLAGRTVGLFLARLHRLYEQKKTAPEGAVDLGKYVTRWLRWTRAGLSELGGSCLPRGPDLRSGVPYISCAPVAGPEAR
jgi:hypothetical protein